MIFFLFQVKATWRQLVNEFSFYSTLGKTRMKKPINGWVGGKISLFPCNKEQVKRMKGQN